MIKSEFDKGVASDFEKIKTMKAKAIKKKKV